jgi:glycosyltransferase involved in cell wall biosynthesis
LKLLYILSEYLPESGGGIISYYAGVLPYLVRAGHEVDVLVASRGFLDRPEQSLDGVRVSYLTSDFLAKGEDGFERFRHGFPSFSAFLPVAWAAFHQVEGGEGYDLVETTDFPMLYAPWVVEPVDVPVNLSLHGSPGQLDWYEYPEADSMDADLMRMVERVGFGSVYALQANSESNAGFWGHLTRRHIPVLPPGYRAERVEAGDAERWRGGLVVGRLQLWKGPRVLCEAMRLLPELEMCWIGRDVFDPETNGPFSARLAGEFPEIFASRLHHKEPVPNEEIRKRIAGAEFLCVPSTWDVFNLTVVEAMELGTPVVCSTAAGASMLIQHGENGFLFDPEQPQELASAIQALRALHQASRQELIQKARQTVMRELEPARLAKARATYYEDLAIRWKPVPQDAWLATVLAPRPKSVETENILQSFTAERLAKAACHQFAAGLRRRLGVSRP